jgi:uncharacterized membrane protein
MHIALVYLLTIIVFIVVDVPYLYLNLDLYKKTTLAISGKGYTNRYYSALIVYIALAFGLLVLVIPRISTSKDTSIKQRVLESIMYGGAFGVATYATFDFTMHFMFEKWDLGLSIMDSIWGGVLCSIVSFIISYC